MTTMREIPIPVCCCDCGMIIPGRFAQISDDVHRSTQCGMCRAPHPVTWGFDHDTRTYTIPGGNEESPDEDPEYEEDDTEEAIDPTHDPMACRSCGSHMFDIQLTQRVLQSFTLHTDSGDGIRNPPTLEFSSSLMVDRRRRITHREDVRGTTTEQRPECRECGELWHGEWALNGIYYLAGDAILPRND